jgi:CheY-like chemotaxis protein
MRLVLLLVEDDENDVILIRRAAERLNSLKQLIVVPDGEEALAYLRGENRYADRAVYPLPDVLILDHLMPRLTGLDILHWLRSEPAFEKLPALVLSNGFSPAQAEAVRRLNAACATKTAGFHEMPAAVEQGIREALRLANREA